MNLPRSAKLSHMNDDQLTGAAREFAQLAEVIRRLRRECPWHREQTAATLSKYLIEESYETLAAIETGDGLADELGDLLLQVLLQTEIARERGQFDLDTMLAQAGAKLVRRHPHVFEGAHAASAEEVAARWEQTKQAERKDAGITSALDGIASHLPALVRAEKLGERARSVGMDWPDLRAVLAKVREEVDEAMAALDAGESNDTIAEELGDCLLALANAPRFVNRSAEETLRRSCEKFIHRFKKVESRAAHSGRSLAALSAQEIEALWQAAKTDK